MAVWGAALGCNSWVCNEALAWILSVGMDPVAEGTLSG